MTKDFTSAMYYLVWHNGFSYLHASQFLKRNEDMIKWFAWRGRQEWKKIETAFIEALQHNA